MVRYLTFTHPSGATAPLYGHLDLTCQRVGDGERNDDDFVDSGNSAGRPGFEPTSQDDNGSCGHVKLTPSIDCFDGSNYGTAGSEPKGIQTVQTFDDLNLEACFGYRECEFDDDTGADHQNIRAWLPGARWEF